MTKKHFFWSTISVLFGVVLVLGLFEVVGLTYPFMSSFFSVRASSEEVLESNNIVNIPESGTVLAETIEIEKKVNKGFLMFRGNAERNYYGEGPLPLEPKTAWKYPKGRMCSKSFAWGETKEWCGTGWTGQTIIWERSDGRTELIFGAFDGAIHFVDADTGEDMMPPFKTGDIIKGSATLDPDGFPIVYTGSRDNKFRAIALDGEVARELWALDADTLGGLWNNDWDSNPVVKDDILYEGGENGIFYAFKLNREIGEDGLVKVSPVEVFSMKSYDDELIKKVGKEVSIENSVVFYKERMYFANSGGRIIGLDVSRIAEGIAPIVFDYWGGDDTDATIAIDEKGMLYVSTELQRFNARSKELGQFIKLNPYTEDPYVWGIPIPKGNMALGGIWATPAIYKDYIFTSTHTGRLLMVHRETGKIRWEEKIAEHAWSSPVVVDDKLLVGTCDGHLRTYSLDNLEHPVLDWDYKLSASCIESTPTVWKGQIFVGTRDGFFYKVAGPSAKKVE